MLDIKLFRENIDVVKEGLKKRGQDINLDELMYWDADRRNIIKEIEDAR